MAKLTTPTWCPHCGARIDAHTATSVERRPSPGDAAFCWKCSGPCIFEMSPAGLMLRLPTRDELVEVALGEGFGDIITAMRASSSPQEAQRIIQLYKRWRDNAPPTTA